MFLLFYLVYSYLMLYPTIFSPFSHVIAWFSTRDDFTSTLVLRSSWSMVDATLARNHISDLLFWSPSCAFMNQAHTDRFIQVCDIGCPTTPCDGLFTDCYNLPLSVHVADCVPVLLYFDIPAKPMVAAVHLGRKWARGGLLPSLLHSLFSSYSDSSALYVFLWPHICSWCYAFGPEASTLFDSSHVVCNGDAFFVDLTSMVLDTFHRFGVLRDHIEVSSFCTYENPDLFFSYRKNGGTRHRMFGMIWLVS